MPAMLPASLGAYFQELVFTGPRTGLGIAVDWSRPPTKKTKRPVTAPAKGDTSGSRCGRALWAIRSPAGTAARGPSHQGGARAAARWANRWPRPSPSNSDRPGRSGSVRPCLGAKSSATESLASQRSTPARAGERAFGPNEFPGVATGLELTTRGTSLPVTIRRVTDLDLLMDVLLIDSRVWSRPSID